MQDGKRAACIKKIKKRKQELSQVSWEQDLCFFVLLDSHHLVLMKKPPLGGSTLYPMASPPSFLPARMREIDGGLDGRGLWGKTGLWIVNGHSIES